MRLDYKLQQEILKALYDRPIEDFCLTEKDLQFPGHSLSEIAEHLKYLKEKDLIRELDIDIGDFGDEFDEYHPRGFWVGHLTAKGQELCEDLDF